MPDLNRVSPLMPSILDRLLGQEAPKNEEIERNPTQLLRNLKASLLRDLENLLNTRCRCGSFPPEFSELQTSLVNYGIPDFTGTTAGSIVGRQDFLAMVRSAVERFEPRLQRVNVSLLNDKDPLDRVLRFRIEGVLVTNYDDEPVMFVSTMEPSSGKYKVSSG
ncbi:MAG: type VI secretion system baseplate subunit TssE [Planctomycetota bacterium]